MSDTHSTCAIAVLGTGLIGAAVARNLARKRFKVAHGTARQRRLERLPLMA